MSREIHVATPEKKRPKGTRARLLIDDSRVYNSEVIERIREKGDEFITPYNALKFLGLEIKEEEIEELNTVVRESGYQLFLNSPEDTTVFPSRNIGEFVKIVSLERFRIAFMLKEPSDQAKQQIMADPGHFLSLIALKKRQRDWQK